MKPWLRTLAIAAAALAVLVVAVLYRQVPHSQTPFKGVEAKTQRLVITQHAGTLRFEKDKDAWRVAASTDSATFAADQDRVRNVLTALASVQVEDEISSRQDRAKDFEVDETSGAQVQCYDGKGAPLAQGIFGKQAPDFSHVYFRYPNGASIFLARGLIRGELGNGDLREWRQRELVSMPESDVQELSITQAGRTLRFSRSSETWTSEGKNVPSGPIYGLIGNLAHLRAEEFIPAGSTQTFSAATIEMKSPKEAVTLHLGTAAKGARWAPVRLNNDPSGAWIPADKAQQLLLTPKELGL